MEKRILKVVCVHADNTTIVPGNQVINYKKKKRKKKIALFDSQAAMRRGKSKEKQLSPLLPFEIPGCSLCGVDKCYKPVPHDLQN